MVAAFTRSLFSHNSEITAMQFQCFWMMQYHRISSSQLPDSPGSPRGPGGPMGPSCTNPGSPFCPGDPESPGTPFEPKISKKINGNRKLLMK